MTRKKENQMKVEFSRKIIFRFLLTVLVSLGVAFGVHIVLLKGEGRFILGLSYIVQLVLSLISFLLLAKISVKKGEQTGFFFLGLSTLKFLVYFLGFRFYFILDGEVTSMEYAVFFVPYIIAFLIEVGFLIAVLNSAPINADKLINLSDEEE